jgi:hypothetical protein
LRNAVAEGRAANDLAGLARREAEQYERGYLDAMAENERLSRRLEALEGGNAGQRFGGRGDGIVGVGGGNDGGDGGEDEPPNSPLTGAKAFRAKQPSLLFGGNPASSLAQMMGPVGGGAATGENTGGSGAAVSSEGKSDGDYHMAVRENEELRHARARVMSHNAELEERIKAMAVDGDGQGRAGSPSVVRFASDDRVGTTATTSSRSSGSVTTPSATTAERIERARRIKAERAAAAAATGGGNSDAGAPADTHSETSSVASGKRRVRKKRVKTPVA